MLQNIHNNLNHSYTPYLCHQDLAPPSRLICSKESQKVSDQGAIRSQQGTKPLYSAPNPSWFSVFSRQSREFLYTRPGMKMLFM